MYTIKQASARSGVPVQLLRAWERRYGVVAPERTPAGYRLYNDATIARLRAMRRLTGDGWSASAAAAQVSSMDQAAIEELVGRPVVAVRNDALSLPAKELTEAFVASAGAMDEPGVEAVLDDMFARGSFEQVASDFVMPAMAALGERWQQGRVDVAAEHAATAAVQRRLGMAYMAAGRPGDERDLVLVGLPPGGRHDLGALAFATAARRAGLAVRYLGADMPVQDWLVSVSRSHAIAIVLGVVVASDIGPAEHVARAIRADYADVLVAFGGRSAHHVDVSAMERALILPDDLSRAVEALRLGLGATPRVAQEG